jgi:hypothetical protein
MVQHLFLRQIQKLKYICFALSNTGSNSSNSYFQRTHETHKDTDNFLVTVGWRTG